MMLVANHRHKFGSAVRAANLSRAVGGEHGPMVWSAIRFEAYDMHSM